MRKGGDVEPGASQMESPELTETAGGAKGCCLV